MPERMMKTLKLGFHVLMAMGQTRPDHPNPQDVRIWCQAFFRHLEIKIHHQGCLIDPSSGPYLIVSNHVSWLDPVAICSIRPASFVSKAEISRIPVLGHLARRGGTVFLDRGSFRSLGTVSRKMEALIGEGKSVALFPEGKTTLGSDVLPFAPALFETACRARIPVLPVAIRYTRNNGKELALSAAFVEGKSFFSSFQSILSDEDLEITLSWTPPIFPDRFSRRDLAACSESRIRGILGGGKVSVNSSFV
ncbi:MAG: lysophospholipid acyltransferase family protein [Leptospirales bacterium]